MAVLERVEHPTHGFLGVVLHVRHVGAHDGQSEMRNHPLELEDALGAGGDLRAKIGEILVDVARRIAARAEDRAHFRLEKPPLSD